MGKNHPDTKYGLTTALRFDASRLEMWETEQKMLDSS